MNLPKRVVVEYEDGTRLEAPFSRLSRQGQIELSAVGLCEAPIPEAPESYLLLQWKDGWKEVVAADSRAVELLRYYTIERVEEVGRLSMEVADANPQLLLIRRLPGLVDSILFVGKDGPKAYALAERVTVKEGGKVEHIFYDKKKPDFSMEEASAASARYTEVLHALEKELQKNGVSVSSALAKEGEEQVALYKELARALGLRGTQRQQDVYGFLRLALEKLERQDK